MEVVKLLVSHGAEVACKDKKAYTPLHAAVKGEAGKQAGYVAHKAKCRALGSTDPGLDVPLVPLLFETFGAAGMNMQDFLSGVVCSYFTQIPTPLEDESAVAKLLPHVLVVPYLGRSRVRHSRHCAPRPRGESVPVRFRRPIK